MKRLAVIGLAALCAAVLGVVYNESNFSAAGRMYQPAPQRHVVGQDDVPGAGMHHAAATGMSMTCSMHHSATCSRGALWVSPAPTLPSYPDSGLSYRKHVYPILRSKCSPCHIPGSTMTRFLPQGETMTRKMTLNCVAILALGLLGAPASAAEPPVLKTQKEKVSYSVGVDLGRNIKRQGLDFDVEALAKGLRDALAGEKLLMTDEELRATLIDFQTGLKKKKAQARPIPLKGAEENQKQGEAFLAKNKTAPGVVTLPSGLQYKILTAGDGKKPVETDTVVCHYRGTLVNGKEFDSSHRHGQPATLKVGGVIQGWREALQLMPTGSKWQLFIPPQLAYREGGAGDVIGPNATLIFELELLGIQ